MAAHISCTSVTDQHISYGLTICEVGIASECHGFPKPRLCYYSLENIDHKGLTAKSSLWCGVGWSPALPSQIHLLRPLSYK